MLLLKFICMKNKELLDYFQLNKSFRLIGTNFGRCDGTKVTILKVNVKTQDFKGRCCRATQSKRGIFKWFQLYWEVIWNRCIQVCSWLEKNIWSRYRGQKGKWESGGCGGINHRVAYIVALTRQRASLPYLTSYPLQYHKVATFSSSITLKRTLAFREIKQKTFRLLWQDLCTLYMRKRKEEWWRKERRGRGGKRRNRE